MVFYNLMFCEAYYLIWKKRGFKSVFIFTLSQEFPAQHRLVSISQPSCLHLSDADIIAVSHHTWMILIYFNCWGSSSMQGSYQLGMRPWVPSLVL